MRRSFNIIKIIRPANNMKLFQYFIFFCCFIGLIFSQEEEVHLESQPSVITDTKDNALYLWIYIKSSANATEVARVVANLQDLVNHVTPPEDANDYTEIWAGVGFGEDFYRKVSRKPRNFTHVERSGMHGILPATGGDIFIHAKSDSKSKLFELTQEVMRKLPKNSVRFFRDIYGFIYQDGKDLSGFHDGTENPKTEWHRREAAIERSTGGSFALTMRWIHNMKLIEETQTNRLEKLIGRTKNDSTRLEPLPPSSHVSRMVGAGHPHKRFEVVRQSQPYGNLYAECGLFFISYANTTEKHDFMLDNMAGIGESTVNDNLMIITKPASGNLFYFPGAEELKQLK